MAGPIYTKQGDHGKTSLFGGNPVSKADLRLEAYGSIDELNAALGLAMSLWETIPETVQQELLSAQNYLFTLGSHLACGDERMRSHLPPLLPELEGRLEQQIDAWQKTLPSLREFILPGGSSGAATLHLARTVCRRAERAVVRLHESLAVEPHILIYLNRLGDYLFVIARVANATAQCGDVIWSKLSR